MKQTKGRARLVWPLFFALAGAAIGIWTFIPELQHREQFPSSGEREEREDVSPSRNQRDTVSYAQGESPLANEPERQTPATVPETSLPPALKQPESSLARSAREQRGSTLEVQVALARRLFCPGPIDGLPGPQTRAAVHAFQIRAGIPPSGETDDATWLALGPERNPISEYTVTQDDIARLQPLSPTWLGKSRQYALEYASVLEFVSERFQAHPNFIVKLNPSIAWEKVRAGERVRVPSLDPGAKPNSKAAYLRVRLRDRVLQAFDAEGVMMCHFPCSIARRIEKRPIGQLRVDVIIPDPNYTFDPEVLTDVPEAKTVGRRLVLPPGPNNPVGLAWIGLNKPGYGIHGTPQPEQVGKTESHGCFRLANWNARHLLAMAWVGMPVYVEP